MALVSYNFTKEVNSSRLTVEIQQSDITISLDHIDTYIDGEDYVVVVYFKSDLSNDEQTLLATIIDDHEPIPLEDEPQIIKIQEEDYNHPTGGHYRCYGVEFTASNNASTSYDFSFPYPVALMTAIFKTNSNAAGDTVEFIIAPDTTIGLLVSNVSSESTSIPVSQTAIDNVSVGQHIKLTDGVHSDESVVIAINDASNTLTINDEISNSYSVSSPTYIQKSVKMAQNIYLESSGMYDFGQCKIGGSYIPANTTIRIIYTNSNDQDIKARPIFEILY